MGLPACDMGFAQRLEYRHAGRMAVAQHAGQLGLLDQGFKQIGRKALRLVGEVAPFEQCRDAGDLPMPGGRVLARGDLGRRGVGAVERLGGRDALGPLAGGGMVRVIEPEVCQMGQCQRSAGSGTMMRDMAQGIRAGIAERGGVRCVADAE